MTTGPASFVIRTYRQLYAVMSTMTEEQLDRPIMVERQSASGECYTAMFEVAGENHGVLEPGHPLFYVEDIGDEYDDR